MKGEEWSDDSEEVIIHKRRGRGAFPKGEAKLVPARTRWSIRETAVLSCAFSTWVLVT